MTPLERFKPGLPKQGLFFVAAALWGFAGAVLCARGWEATTEIAPVLRWALGLIFVIGFYHYVFSRIPQRHIDRINAIQHSTPCAFSFLDWRGYILMATMMTLGVTLRWSGIVSAQILGTVYVAMGTLLLFSAFRFAAAGISYGTN